MPQGKRGMILENSIERTNQVYKNKGLALVDKVPTPWVVHYDKRTKRVKQAFPKEKSTVDFMGISHGRSIAFDAKYTKERTRFPLKNIEHHQINYLIQHKDQRGISFFLVHFEKHQESYFVPIERIIDWWEMQGQGGRKSIPYDWFVLNCDLVRSRNGVILDYLEHCNTIYQNKRK